MTMQDDLDRPIWGAEAIAREAGLFINKKSKRKGEPDTRKCYYLLETGVIAARRVKGRDEDGKIKNRGQWVSTPRLIRNSLLPDASTAAAWSLEMRTPRLVIAALGGKLIARARTTPLQLTKNLSLVQ
jgi:hypothetical protein